MFAQILLMRSPGFDPTQLEFFHQVVPNFRRAVNHGNVVRVSLQAPVEAVSAYMYCAP